MTDAVGPSDWSDGQLATLAQLFTAFVEPSYEGESERHAALAAAALSEVADPADLRQVRLTMSLLGSRGGAMVLAQRSQSIGRMSPAAREALLHSWSTSPLPQRRTFFQLTKRLACFFGYADPGPAGTNPRWSDVGYTFADEPVVETRPIERALVHVDPLAATPLTIDADVVVVGSGAGGGVAAARLAETGRDVLVVEAAPYVAEPDLPRDELDGFNRLYLDHGLVATGDLSLAILAGAAVGGGTLINWTTSLEPPDWVRHEWAAEHGLDDFEGASTDRQLARLHEELAFSAPPNIPAKDQLILDGAAALGWEAAATERDTAGCGDCGACSFGCRRGAKRSGQRLHLAQAAAHGARLLAGAEVHRVEVGSAGVTGVSGRIGGAGGRPFAVRASTVVVCAGALRTPALLLRSGIDHPAVGRNLRLHPTAIIAARMPHEVAMWRGTTQAARSVQHLREGVLIESAPGHPGLIALAFPWRGAAEMAELMRDVRNYAPLLAIARDVDGGRVSVSRAGRPRVDYRISARDAATARRGLVAAARMARAGGAMRLVALGTPGAWHDETGSDDAFQRFLGRLATFDFGPNRGSLFSAHQMGSARAGANARTSACDPRGQARRDAKGGLVRGLFVGDASLFPTAVGVNPMVSVMLMASRVAEAIAVA